MSEQEKQEGQKTVVAFIAGLLIGGLLVWVFSSPAPVEVTDDASGDTNTEEPATADRNDNIDSDADGVAEVSVPTLPTGEGAITVSNQKAGTVVSLASAEFPTPEGWVTVRDYNGESVGGILGAARYSQSQGLIPKEVELLRPTVSGSQYAVVFSIEDGVVNAEGKLDFNPTQDKQIEGIMATFKAE